jgi:hypothetical protein
MKCKSITKKIDQLVFETDGPLVKELSEHLDNCKQCKIYYKESKVTKRLTGLLREEPELINPDNLTNEILSTIENVDQIPAAQTGSASRKIIRLVSRSLAAASVLLIVIFGIEQYIVVDKISRLETFASSVSTKKQNVSLKNIIIYNSGFSIENTREINIEKIKIPSFRKISSQLMFARLTSVMTSHLKDQKVNRMALVVGSVSVDAYRRGLINSR